MRKNKKTKNLILELIILSLLIGFIPDLIIDGWRDLWGVCGFDSTICNDLQLQGTIQLILALVCSIGAFTVALMLTDEYNSDDNDSENDCVSNSKEDGHI